MVDSVLPRYLRKVDLQKRLLDDAEIDEEMRREAQLAKISSLRYVKWLTNFVALPSHWLLSDIEKTFGVSYKDLDLYPMDISSALPVLALNINRDEPSKILDLCCCPGGKLQYLREVAADGSFILGVDIADQRLNVCRSLLHRYQSRMSPNTRRKKRLFLFNCDGCEFSASDFGKLVYDSDIILNLANNDKFKMNKSTKRRYEKELLAVSQQLHRTGNDAEIRSSPLFDLDYVLVDAECTHDASYRHLKQLQGRNKWNKRRREDEEGDFWDEEFNFDALEGKEKPAEEQDADMNEAENGKEAVLSHGIPLQTTHLMDASTTGDEAHVVADSEGRKQLQALQRRLLHNGFHRLKPGGVLVYSTCSADTAQNEDIVQWFLENESEAVLEPALTHLFPMDRQTLPADIKDTIQAAHQGVLQSKESTMAINSTAEEMCAFFTSIEKPFLKHGSIPGTIRVDAESGMSGHFVARFRRKSAE